METPAPGLAQYFDNWYADMARSPVVDEIQQRHLELHTEISVLLDDFGQISRRCAPDVPRPTRVSVSALVDLGAVGCDPWRAGHDGDPALDLHGVDDR